MKLDEEMRNRILREIESDTASNVIFLLERAFDAGYRLAIERAARLADDMDYGLGDLAAAIRALGSEA